jgi:hypothetical protein
MKTASYVGEKRRTSVRRKEVNKKTIRTQQEIRAENISKQLAKFLLCSVISRQLKQVK